MREAPFIAATIFAFIALVAAPLIAQPAAADEPSPSQPAVAGLDLHLDEAGMLAQVKSFMRARKFQQAIELLSPLRQVPMPSLEVLFLSGLIDEQTGQYAAAASEFRRMLARDPTLPRPRLELARSLFLMKDYEGARYNFEQLMAADIPPNVRTNIESFMVRIREQVPSFNFDLEMVSDSNPAQLTSTSSVTLGGLNYKLNSTAPGKAVTGLLAGLSGRIPLPSDPSVYARFSAQDWEFPGRSYDQAYLQATAGKRVILGRHALSAEIGAQQFWYQSKRLYSGPMFRVLDYYQQKPTLAWQFGADRRITHYPDYAYLDGWQQIFTLTNIYAPSVANRIESGVNVVVSKAQSSPYSFSNPGVFVRFTHEWPGGLITSTGLQYGYAGYRGIDPVFLVKRQDRDMRGEISVLDRRLHFGLFSPRLSVGYIRHESNIPIDAYRRAYVNLGVTKDF